jgi:hypothetical protein
MKGATPMKKNNAISQESQLARLEAKEAAARFLTRSFGQMNRNEIPAIDAVIMRRLNEALCHTDEMLFSACFLRGLLPSDMAAFLRMAAFLSFTLPDARAAQTETGVPASFLIAEAYQTSGTEFHVDHFYLTRPSSHDLFATGKNFRSFQESFLQRAEELKRQRWFSPILRAMALNDPKKYLEQIRKCCHKKDGEIAATIEQHSLFECDQLKTTCYF